MSSVVTLPGFELLPTLEGDHPVWGIDPSTKRIAVARLEPTYIESEPTSLSWSTLSLSQAGGLRRLATAATDIATWLPDGYGLNEMGPGQPAAIYVEQPFATRPEHVHPQSYYVIGILLAALGNAYPAARIETVTPAEWKSRALGKGRGFAKKPEVFAWAQNCGYTGTLEDEADAVGIAVAGAILSRS